MINLSSGLNSLSGNQANRNVGGGSIFVDASIVKRLKESGYSATATAYSLKDVEQGKFAISQMQVVGGKSIPTLADGAGNTYVVDERENIYLLGRSRINPNEGVPYNGPTASEPNSTSVGVGISAPTGGTNVFIDNQQRVPPDPPIYTVPPINNPGGNTGIPPIITYPEPPLPSNPIGSGNIYGNFNIDDIVPNQQELVTRALWSNNIGNLISYYTSSMMTPSQKLYYLEVWNSNSQDSCNANAQFDIAYGHIFGSGSDDFGGQIEDTPTRAVYNQNRLLTIGGDQPAFIINGNTAESIYVINVKRARMLEAIDKGSVELNLAPLNRAAFGGAPQFYTGSNVGVKSGITGANCIRIIDDSSLNPAKMVQNGEMYQLVSGSIEDGIFNPSNPVVYGLIFRRTGIMVLDANMLDASASFGTVTVREKEGYNAQKLFTSISGAALLTDTSGDRLGFKGRATEKVKSTHYFVRVKNAEYNFSNNPSFVTGSEGDLRYTSMYNDPKVYITTIGLYNNNKDLVAVAKVSQPIQKAFTKEALIEVKLEF